MATHARFEQFALGHVLGGLERAQSEEFRSHLRSCADCRSRVAELRGISSTLDAAAREERRRGREESVTRRDRSGEVSVPERRSVFDLGRLLVILALVVGVLFWNLHLRTTAATYFDIAEERGAILRDLAAGEIVAVTGPAADAARIAVASGRVIIVMTDAGPLESDERLVAWLQPQGSATQDRVVLAIGPRTDVEVGVRLQREAAVRVVVSRERGLLAGAPQGQQLVAALLP
jgi:anti-sigma factor RsiW